MGKSSIIQALLLLKQSYEIAYLQTQNKVDLSNDYINLETAEDVCFAFAEDDNKKIGITLSLNTGEIHKWDIDASKPKDKILDCKYSGNNNLSTLSLFSKNFIYLEAERWGPRETYNKKEKRSYNTKLGIQGELTPAYLANAIATNEQIGINELQNPNLIESGTIGLYENINAWMSDIMNIPLKTQIKEIDESKVKLNFNIAGARGRSYSALQVGFGLTFCLPIVLAILSSQKGDLLIIENPEAHLHPTAQVKIGLLLALAAKNGVQIIIESHSDHILNSIRYSYKEGILNENLLKIIFIRGIKANENTNYSIPDYVTLNEKGKLSHRPTDFFDVWDKMLTNLL